MIAAHAPMQIRDIVRTEIAEWRASPALAWMQIGQRYYNSDNDIKQRTRTAIGEGGRPISVANIANNKLAHAFVRELVDQKTQYLLGKPYSLQGENTTHLEALGMYAGSELLRVLRRWAKDAIVYGVGWLHPCYDEQGVLVLKRLPPTEMIPLWRDADHTELDAMIRVYETIAYAAHDKRKVTHVEFWAPQCPVEYYIFDGDLKPDPDRASAVHFNAVAPDGADIPLFWEHLPFVALKYNDEELPLVYYVKSLIDAYDRVASDDTNMLEDLPNSIFVLRNYDGQELGEFRHNLATYRAVKVTDDGGVDTLEPKLDITASSDYLERLRRDIYAFGRGVDTRSERVSGATSGVALKHEYTQLDLDCNQLESELQASFARLLAFVDAHLANTGVGDFVDDEVTLVCNRDIIISEADAVATVVKTMGITSLRTVLEQIPWVDDVDKELGRLDTERKEAQERVIDEFGAAYGKLRPPGPLDAVQGAQVGGLERDVPSNDEDGKATWKK